MNSISIEFGTHFLAYTVNFYWIDEIIWAKPWASFSQLSTKKRVKVIRQKSLWLGLGPEYRTQQQLLNTTYNLLWLNPKQATTRGGDTSMAGMAVAIPGVLNVSKTGDTMGKIRWHRGKKQEKMAKKLIKWAKETGVSTLAIPAKVGQCRPCLITYYCFPI